jgi:hypothetical protein
MTAKKNKQLAQSAVKAQPTKRENIPFDYAEVLAAEGLMKKQQDVDAASMRLAQSIIKRHGLDAEGLGQDFILDNNQIVFIENIEGK